MPNSIKHSGHGLALQVTDPARKAGLVEENNDGDATRLADVRVHSFDSILLVVDRDPQVIQEDRVAVLVAELASRTKTVFQAIDASVQESGNGYQVQLPPAEDAGFSEGDTVGCQPAPGVLVIHPLEGGVAEVASGVVGRRER